MASFSARVRNGVSFDGGVLKDVQRKHGVKVLYREQSIDNMFDLVVNAVADIIGGRNIKSSSPMYGGIVVFVSSEQLVDVLVDHGIIVNDMYHVVEPLVTPSVKFPLILVMMY